MWGSSWRSYFHLRLLSHKLVGMRPGCYPRGLGGVLTADVVKKGSVCRGIRPWDFYPDVVVREKQEAPGRNSSGVSR